MKKLSAVLGVFIFSLSTLAIAGCNTVEGAGRDVQSVGEGVEEGARETRHDLD